MRKLLFATSAAILAFFLASCDSLPFLGGGGEEEATPEASPSPTAEAPASPTPSPTPFASPEVPQKRPGAPALIQSSNPDERVSQLEQQGGGQISATGQVKDPFTGEITIPLPSETGNVENETFSGDAGPVVTQLPRQQVPELPKLGELSRPPQVGGTTLVGDVPPIRLTSLQEELINGFRTVDALTDDTSKLSEYRSDLFDNIGRSMRLKGIRRELLLSNRALYRRLEKVLAEYELAGRLWNIYGDESEPDAVRCSSIAPIKQAIDIYQVPTVTRGQLRCAERMDMLEAVWGRGNDILEAAIRDRDFNARSLADIPSLPDVGGPATLAQLPIVPEFESPEQTRSIGLGSGPVEPIPEIPSVATQPRTVPGLPELPVQDPPPRDPSAIPPPTARPQTTPATPPPPPPPSTDLAEGVKVTGIVEVGSEKQIIVEAPNEATSRYVRVGQLIAGGKVLVKRIDFENGEAIVILEENDVEIRKRVGEEPAVGE